MSCRESKELSFWSLIDANTILVYESTQPVLVKDKAVGSMLHSLSAKEYVTCVQSITKNSYDLIYVCNVTDAEWAGINSANKASSRLLDGITILK
ncbi:MAG: hypothetical protein HWD62_08010 [Cyclobacteriaceae bacterium]|nr:MAG: hypothetical protein HWD62_08010 [Cyclobacteriaceae bacterium]